MSPRRARRRDLTAHDRRQLSGTLYVSREAAKHMEGGAIVNISSELGSLGMASDVDYRASKAGVLGLTRALAGGCRSRALPPREAVMFVAEARFVTGASPAVDGGITMV